MPSLSITIAPFCAIESAIVLESCLFLLDSLFAYGIRCLIPYKTIGTTILVFLAKMHIIPVTFPPIYIVEYYFKGDFSICNFYRSTFIGTS